MPSRARRADFQRPSDGERGAASREEVARSADGSAQAVEPKRSAFRGLHWNKQCKKWHVRISYGNKQYHVGLFDAEERAARAYDAAARQHNGERAQLNLSQEG